MKKSTVAILIGALLTALTTVIITILILWLLLGGTVFGFVYYCSTTNETFETNEYTVSAPVLYEEWYGGYYEHLFKTHNFTIKYESSASLNHRGYGYVDTEEEYAYYLFDSMKNSMYFNFDGYAEHITIGEYKLLEFEYRDLLNLVYHNALYVQKTDEGFWYILFETNPEDFEDFCEVIPEIIASFKLK